MGLCTCKRCGCEFIRKRYQLYCEPCQRERTAERMEKQRKRYNVQNRKPKQRNCRCCGKLFLPAGQEQYCLICRDISKEDRAKVVYLKEKPKKPVEVKSLSQMQKEAAAHGMSYGQYVAHITGD